VLTESETLQRRTITEQTQFDKLTRIVAQRQHLVVEPRLSLRGRKRRRLGVVVRPGCEVEFGTRAGLAGRWLSRTVCAFSKTSRPGAIRRQIDYGLR